MTVKFPEVEVDLIGRDSNAFGIIAAVRKALKRGGASKEQTDLFVQEATSGDYDQLLLTVMKWVSVN